MFLAQQDQVPQDQLDAVIAKLEAQFMVEN